MSMKEKTIRFCEKEIIICEKTKIVCLPHSDILFITTDCPYLVIMTTDNQKIYVKLSLSSLARKLPLVFFQCSQSVVVNLYFIKTYGIGTQHILYLDAKRSFVVSRRRQKGLRERLLLFKKYYYE